jgi:hypothetical protein
MYVEHGNSYSAVRQAKRAGRQRRGTGVARLESLEARRLFSGTLYVPTAVTIEDGILTIMGSEDNDRIDLNIGSWGHGQTHLTARFGQTVDLVGIRGIRMYGLGGDDFMHVWRIDGGHASFDSLGTPEYEAARFDIPVTMYGGAGDDELISESSGDDLIVGGAGFDRSMASEGHDVYSAEIVERYLGIDVAGELCDSFMWREVGEQLYGDPFTNPNPNGSYHGVSYPQPEPVDHGGDTKPILVDDSQHHALVPEPVIAPVESEPTVMITPPAMVFLTAKPITTDALWDDAK